MFRFLYEPVRERFSLGEKVLHEIYSPDVGFGFNVYEIVCADHPNYAIRRVKDKTEPAAWTHANKLKSYAPPPKKIHR